MCAAVRARALKRAGCLEAAARARARALKRAGCRGACACTKAGGLPGSSCTRARSGRSPRRCCPCASTAGTGSTRAASRRTAPAKSAAAGVGTGRAMGGKRRRALTCSAAPQICSRFTRPDVSCCRSAELPSSSRSAPASVSPSFWLMACATVAATCCAVATKAMRELFLKSMPAHTRTRSSVHSPSRLGEVTRDLQTSDYILEGRHCVNISR